MPRTGQLLKRMGVVICVLALFGACSGKAPRHGRYSNVHDLKNLPQFDIPIVINDRVEAWLDYFQGTGRKHMNRYLQRSGRYVPAMRKMLREEGMPEDLVYIALIESGFNIRARSHASAVGPWQFIRGTGRRYKLRIDGWVDERCNPTKATRAAIAYFRDLHDEFGDWYLAMAGYNAGEGRVRKAIKMTGSKDFWKIAKHRRALRAETRDYVPKFIAAAIIAKMPERFGFNDIEYNKPIAFEVVAVETQTDLAVVAKCAGANEEEVFELNAHLHQGATPPGEKNYTVRLPQGTTKQFHKQYAKLPKDQRIQVAYHKVRKGDTLSKIARLHGVSVSALKRANNISSSKHLRRGRKLVIPSGGAYARYAKVQASRSSSTNKLVRHKVRGGETAGTIARKYGVTVGQLKRWNNLNRHLTVRKGQRLKVYQRVRGGSGKTRVARAGGEGYHTLKRGETLGHVAEAYGVSTKQLMAWNEINDPRRVRAGAKLTVYGGKKEKIARAGTTTAIDLSQAMPEATPESATRTVVLKSGQTLGHVAEAHGVSTKQLMAWNKIRNPRRVRAGQKLVIRGGSANPVASAAVKEPAGEEAVLPETTAMKLAARPETTTAKRTHVLKPGQTLGHVAEIHGVSTKQIMQWNDIRDPRRVRAGAKLVIRGGSSAVASSAPTKTTSATTAAPTRAARYTVKSGETLGGIANRHGVTTKEIMAWNKIRNPKSVRAGQSLIIKKSGAAKAPSSSTPKAASENLASTNGSANTKLTYRVRPGDTLWDIARRHRVTIAQLKKWNDLSNPSKVRPGTNLKIHRN